MNKNSIRKEIADLIDSIKEHSDNNGTEKHVPQLELELILLKIEKLYEKSIIYNFLNTMEGKFQNAKTNAALTEAVLTFENKVVEKANVPKPEESAPKIESENLKILPEKEIKNATTPAAAPLKKSSFKDIKDSIGLNEKFRFINELFNGNSHEYNIAINQINICENLEECNEYIESLKVLYKWKDDSESAAELTQLVIKKFK